MKKTWEFTCPASGGTIGLTWEGTGGNGDQLTIQLSAGQFDIGTREVVVFGQWEIHEFISAITQLGRQIEHIDEWVQNTP